MGLERWKTAKRTRSTKKTVAERLGALPSNMAGICMISSITLHPAGTAQCTERDSGRPADADHRPNTCADAPPSSGHAHGLKSGGFPHAQEGIIRQDGKL